MEEQAQPQTKEQAMQNRLNELESEVREMAYENRQLTKRSNDQQEVIGRSISMMAQVVGGFDQQTNLPIRDVLNAFGQKFLAPQQVNDTPEPDKKAKKPKGKS